MTPRGLREGFGSAWLAVAAVLLPAAAHAGVPFLGPVTVHGFTAQIRGATQDESNAGDDRIGRGSANQKQLAEACLGRSLAKTERIVLVTDCGDVVAPFEARVFVVDTDTDPATVVQFVGGASLDPVARSENRSGETTEIEYDVMGSLGCDDAFATFRGFARAKLGRLDPKVDDSPICTQSANGRGLGAATIDGEAAVLESLSFKAGAESKKIEVDADDINEFFRP